MARNTGNNSRKGAVKERSQVYNPATGNFIKRDSTTGKFMEVKKDGTPFKGIRKEALSVKSNPSVKKSTALKAERAVILVKNAIKAKK
jgi:hypothetical protein